MTIETTIHPDQNAGSGSMPDLIAYQVIDRDGDQQSIWVRVGAAWMHQDGNGMQLRLDAIPVGGTVTLRTPPPPREEA